MAEASIYPIAGFSEPFSCISHLFAAPVFAVLGVMLVRRGRHGPGRLARMMALGVFAFAAVFLLSMSGVYHLLTPETAGREVLRRLDHVAIFVLIAASFTPAHMILFTGWWWRWGMIVLVWALAITALTLKTIYFTEISEGLGLAFYIGLGWVGVISGAAVWRQYGFPLVRGVLWGGLAYTMGAVAEFLRLGPLVPGVIDAHEVFHVAVLAGLSLHWRVVHRIAGWRGDRLDSTAGNLMPWASPPTDAQTDQQHAG